MNKEKYLKLKKDFIVLYLARNGIMTFLITLFTFSLDLSSDQELYCSELVVCSLKKMNITLSKQTQVFKYRIISPTDLIEELVEKKLVKNVLILE